MPSSREISSSRANLSVRLLHRILTIPSDQRSTLTALNLTDHLNYIAEAALTSNLQLPNAISTFLMDRPLFLTAHAATDRANSATAEVRMRC